MLAWVADLRQSKLQLLSELRAFTVAWMDVQRQPVSERQFPHRASHTQLHEGGDAKEVQGGLDVRKLVVDALTTGVVLQVDTNSEDVALESLLRRSDAKVRNAYRPSSATPHAPLCGSKQARA